MTDSEIEALASAIAKDLYLRMQQHKGESLYERSVSEAQERIAKAIRYHFEQCRE